VQDVVGIRQLTHRVFPESGPYVRDPRRLRHYRDLLTPWGVALDEGMLRRGGRNSFRAMSAELVEQLDLPAAVDLVVLAHSTPDFDPIFSAASHLAYLCPGEPRAFAVSDHGVGAPFAALRVIAAHLRWPEFTDALLVVLDQTSLPNYDEQVHRQLVEDSGVAVLIGAAGRSRVAGVACLDDVGRDDVPRLVTRLLEGEPAGTLLLAGPTLELAAASGPVHRASSRYLCTAVWVALSEHLDQWRDRFERVLVVDHDDRLRQLHAASIALRPGRDV
jgi:hypothetical protein